VILVRHASAGDRDEWAGDDSERPLDEKGERQARELVERLAGFDVEEILTSPAVRCLQTVTSLAAARGLEAIVVDELSEERQSTDGAHLLRELAGRDVVVCGHRGLDAALVQPPKWRKGAAFVVDDGLHVVREV
jgi:8-oxo-dGTP diphosphatase